jgi:hypothetical protein
MAEDQPSWILKLGERVVITWANCSISGVLRHRAQATGECWIIDSDLGVPFYVQQFETISRERPKAGEAK